MEDQIRKIFGKKTTEVGDQGEIDITNRLGFGKKKQ